MIAWAAESPTRRMSLMHTSRNSSRGCRVTTGSLARASRSLSMSFSRHAGLNPMNSKRGALLQEQPRSLAYRPPAIPRRVALRQSPTPLRQKILQHPLIQSTNVQNFSALQMSIRPKINKK